MSSPRSEVYTQCGLRLRSEIELHLPIVEDGSWDIDICWGDDIHDSEQPPPGEEIAVYGTADAPWYTATRTEDGYRLRFRNCGEFLFSAELDRIDVRPDPEGRHELLPVLLAGTGLSFLLTLRGETVLHASAVAIGGDALAFVGQSGRGKTTVATLLCADGAELVTDDVLVVRAGPPTTCLGGASELRLRDKAATIVRERPDASTRTTVDDRLAYAPPARVGAVLPVAGIVIPSPSQEIAEIEIRRLEPATAVFALLSFPRIHGWSDAEVLSRDFATIGKLVNDVPVYEATIPWGPPFDPGIATRLAALAQPADPSTA